MTKTVSRLCIAAAAFAVTGCASGSAVTQRPVWVSSGINGLQRSECNCGGVETRRQFRERRAAEVARQTARQVAQAAGKPVDKPVVEQNVDGND